MSSSRNARNISSGANQIFFWALTADYNSLERALEGGMSVNVIDPVTTDSPLMIACRKGHTNIVRLCLEYGAKNDPHPEFGQTALHASISEQKIESARVLLEIAANSDADHIISNLSDPSGQTPLHTAAYIGSTAMIELLLHHGASISSVDAQGQTALHLCASSGVKICLAMLLDHGGDDMIDLQDNGGNTALHHATFHGRMECVRLLLETAADVSIRNYEGYTAYNIASSEGHHQIGLLLHEYRDMNTSGPSSATNSNQPTPSKKLLPSSSQLGTPLHYQTPQSSSKYGRQTSAEYAYSPSSQYAFAAEDDDTIDSPERQIRLNILPQSTMNNATGVPISTRQAQPSSLTLHVPTNPLSAMYGSNSGLDNMDSINSFLPRPHTVSGPTMKRPVSTGNTNGSGLHAAALRGQSNSARGSPSMKNTIMYPSNDANKLTHNDLSAHNHRNNISNSSTGSERDTYKVLTKQQHHSSGFIPPSLSRQSSESVASRLSNQSDPGVKLQLFDTLASTGIPTYTKSNIIPEQSRRRNSADSPSQIFLNPSNSSQMYQDNLRRGYVTEGYDGIHTSHSSSAIERLHHSHTNSTYGHDYHSADNLDQINAHSSSSNAYTDHNATSSYNYGSIPVPVEHSYSGSADTEGYGEYSTEVATESCDYAAPVEEFTCLDRYWTVYYTEDQHLYYLDMANDHSQWEDPREFGLRLFSAVTDSPTGRTSEPPKSPSPKALERSGHGRSFQFNNIQYNNHEGGDPSGNDNESPRVRDIKPIKLNWDGRKEEEETFVLHTETAGQKRGNNRTRTAAAAVKRLQIEEFSSDSSDEDMNSAIKIRFHRATEAIISTVTDPLEKGYSKDEEEKNEGILLDKEKGTEEEVLDLDQIALSGEKFRPGGVVGSLFPESDLCSQKQHSPTGTVVEAAEHIEKGRIRLLTSQYEKAGSKPLSPANSPLHSSSFYSSNNNNNRSNSNTSKSLQDVKEIEKPKTIEIFDINTPEKNTKKAFQPTDTDIGNIQQTTEISREEAEVYIQAVVQGMSLQEVGEWLDRDGRSQAFRLQTLTWADEAVILNPINSNSSSNNSNSTNSKIEVENTSKETIASLKDDPILGKYAKMISMGVPAGNVLMKLKMENIAIPQRNRLMRAAGYDLEVEPNASTTTTTTTTIDSRKVETIDELKADSILGKYAKMLGMGVPAGNVLIKLKLENIEIQHRNRLMRAAGQEEEKDETVGSTSSMVRRPANMQNLHWNTLPEERVKNSIWAKANTSTNEIDIAETDLKELERLFGKQKEEEKRKNNFETTRNISQKAIIKQSLQLQYLDTKRAQNIVIGLNPFKSLGNYIDLLKAFCSLDSLNNTLTIDMIDNFINLLPTEAELKRIDKINGSKHPAELFFQTVMLFYPELPNRLQCFSICLNFPIKYENILEKTKKLINACNQVLSSANLSKLLQRMLVIGNILNEGTKRGGASGFTLDSLTKVVNTKGVDKKTSVLDYVIKSLYDKQEESILAVLTELNLIEASARLSGTEILKEYNNLEKLIETLEHSYSINTEKYNEPSFNSPTAKKLINHYQIKLNEYLLLYKQMLIEYNNTKMILIKKINDIILYFGEDAQSCSTEAIFSRLYEFLRAVEFSKASIEWKLYRSNSSNSNSSI